MRTNRIVKRSLIIFAVLVTITAMYNVVTMARNAHSGSDRVVSVQTTPADLTGTWHQTSGMPGVEMTAEISASGIQIDMKIDSSHGIFWMGSFDTSDKTGNSFSVNSLADPDAQKILQGSLFGSTDTSKKFTYKDGKLSYNFSMMEVHTIVYLERGSK